MSKRSVEAVQKELDEHFAQEAEHTDPFSLKVVKFDHFRAGGMALIKLPYRSDTADFAVACRSIKKVADEARVVCLFFDSRQEYESFDVNHELALARFGLCRRAT